MQEIVLVRHAAATGQEAEAPLTVDGQHQARALAHFLRQFRIDGVICSRFRRAVESIDPFCRRAGLRVETDPRLVERVLSVRNLTAWREHLRRSFDELDYCLEDGESSRTAQERGMSVVREALVSTRRCVLVTHGNLLALILKWADATVGFELWSRLSNPDVFVLHTDGHGARGFSRVWGQASALPDPSVAEAPSG
jgi:2,3-bisphosphoglycerate-dependent phosphoglycerate mutase